MNDRTAGRFEAAVERLDAYNREDPNVERVDGEEWPKELLYAQRMSRTLDRLAPQASEPLRLAVRAQHLRRWRIPRSDYPAGREGYRRWRSDLAAYHAEQAAEVLAAVGYEAEQIQRVQALIRKERLKRDPEAQTLEDVACLVFLEHYLSDFARRHPADKVVDILRKTWRKMSEQGRQAALALDLPAAEAALVQRALTED